jgi:signal transduction histidine kinase
LAAVLWVLGAQGVSEGEAIDPAGAFAGGLRLRWQQSVDTFVPPVLRTAAPGATTADRLHRARLAVSFGITGALSLIVFCIIHLLLGVYPMAIALAIGAIGVALSVVLLRQTASIALAANWGVGWAFGAIAVVVWIGGGLLSPALQFNSVLVLVALLVAGTPSGAFWAAAGITQALVLYLLGQGGYAFPTIVSEQHIWFMWFPTTTGILLVTFAMALLYEAFKRSVLAAVERANLDLARARDEAERASRAKDIFLANMSHEIRTPMNAVIGLTELLLDESLEAQQRDYVETVRDSGRHLLGIIDDILDFSKIEAGRIDIAEERFDLIGCVEGCVEMFRPIAADKGVALEQRMAPQTPRHVLGDVGRVRQVLMNLLGNAVKFTDAGSIDVVLHAQPAGGSAWSVGVEVCDTGIGMPPELAKRLFQPFVQGDFSATRRYGGSGLGLVISKRLSELMGGTIGFDSVPARGTTFRFTFSAGAVPDAAPAATAVRLRVPEAAAEPRRLRVLVVEDNLVNQAVAAGLLRKLGHEAELAGDGVEALEAIERNAYDVVLMDVQMPRMDGLTAARRICERWPGDQRPRIIAMTANAFTEDREACLEAGMDAYLPKPVELARLKAELDA